MTKENPNFNSMSIESIQEFSDKIATQEYSEKFDNLVTIFQFFSKDKDYLTKEELEDILTNNVDGNAITIEEFEEIYSEVKTKSEDKIDIKMFVSTMLSK